MTNDEWIDKAEIGIEAVLEHVPYIGSLISTLVAIFWPPKAQVDVWEEIKDRVEQLIDDKIDQRAYQDLRDSLGDQSGKTGLIGAIALFQKSLKSKNPQDPQSEFDAANTVFVDAMALFMPNQTISVPVDPIPILPLFAQAANLHLSLIRDGVIGQYCTQSMLTNPTDPTDLGFLELYANWADEWMAKAIADAKTKVPTGLSSAGFNYANRVARFMQLSVGNFREMWPYFDPIAYPNGATGFVSKKEIYFPVTEAAFDGADAKKRGYGSSVGIDANHVPPTIPAERLQSLDVYCKWDGYSDYYSGYIGAECNYANGTSTPYSGWKNNQKPAPNPTPPAGGWRSRLGRDSYWMTVDVSGHITRVIGQYDTNGGIYGSEFFDDTNSSTGSVPPQNYDDNGTITAAQYDDALGYEIVAPKGYALSSVWVGDAGFPVGAKEVVLGFRIGG